MGLVPHQSPQGVYASEVYKNDFSAWMDRLDIPDLGFRSFIPQLSLPKLLKEHGYRTVARVSMPVLNGFTLISKFFDDYKLMPNHNDFSGMVDEIEFAPNQPTFYFLNIGENLLPLHAEGYRSAPHFGCAWRRQGAGGWRGFRRTPSQRQGRLPSLTRTSSNSCIRSRFVAWNM